MLASDLMVERGYDGRVENIKTLTNDDLRKRAPSIFQAAPHESRSERYAMIPTIRMVDGLRDDGWLPYAAKQATSRVPGKADYTKHMVRFRHKSWSKERAKVGDEILEMVLVNSHDGTSAYELLNGVFRLACLNGLIVASKPTERLRIHHTGDAVSKVVTTAQLVLDRASKVAVTMDRMKAIALHPNEALTFAATAAELRYEREDMGFDVSRLLRPQRREDQGEDLWRVYNRVQENLLNGGQIRAGRRGEDGKPIRTTKARPVRAIDADININTGLWEIAEATLERKERG